MTSRPDEPTFTSADDDLSAFALTEAGLAPEDADLPNPLDGFTPSGDVEADAAAELEHLDDTEADEGFRERLARESQRLQLVMATDYWCCLCFGTEEQKQAFLVAMDWLRHGTRYLDGRVLAAQQGIDLPDDPQWPSVRSAGTWAKRAHTVEQNRALGEEEA